MSVSPSFLASAALLALCFLTSCDTFAAKHKATSNKAASKAIDHAGEFANFNQWQGAKEFIDLMVTRHQFERAEVVRQLSKAHYIESAIQLIKPAPPGKPKNWAAYRKLFVDPIRINAGAQFWRAYENELLRAEQEFGVPAEVIVGIIGVETVYGRNTGNFRVMDVITTLAFAYPDTPKRLERMTFFRGELENALLLARENKRDPYSLRGSYAGAIGWPQFMPSSIRKYAVDFDADGVIDLSNSPIDAIGSVAKYLQQHGWQKDQPSVFNASVSLEKNAEWTKLLDQGLIAKFSVAQIFEAGVVFAPEVPQNLLYGLIDLQNGNAETDYYLGTNNFFAITQYNRSYFYAMSVLELGQAIKNARQK